MSKYFAIGRECYPFAPVRPFGGANFRLQAAALCIWIFCVRDGDPDGRRRTGAAPLPLAALPVRAIQPDPPRGGTRPVQFGLAQQR